LITTGKKGVIYRTRVRDLADEGLIANATVQATFVGYVKYYLIFNPIVELPA
jgi:hypothetical protein